MPGISHKTSPANQHLPLERTHDFGITQADLSGYLDVEPEDVSCWIRRNCEPAPGSTGEHTLNDWARRIMVIQQYPADQYTPEQWQALARGLDLLTIYNV